MIILLGCKKRKLVQKKITAINTFKLLLTACCQLDSKCFNLWSRTSRVDGTIPPSGLCVKFA